MNWSGIMTLMVGPRNKMSEGYYYSIHYFELLGQLL